MNNPLANAYIERHNTALHDIIQQTDIPAPRLKEALLYALFPGGKRLRPLLVYLCGELVEAPLDSLDIIAAAIELVHCYSLVKDDLPAMDNDDYRRGRLTCHRAFNEATAILIGDGMQELANELLLTRLPMLSDRQVIQITCELLKASGFSGMVSGQSLDLTELSQKNITHEQLQYIHHLKTGRLFSACVHMALISGNPCDIKAKSLRDYASRIGIAFQLQDDYQDRYSSNDTLGKHRASDAANQKTTFATLLSQQALLELINEYYNQAQMALSPLGEKAKTLIELTDFLHHRTQ